MPKVSIIVPNFNHAKYLPQRLNSIFNQTYQDFEVIILDDCSKDNSREILTNYQENSKITHLIFDETNSGKPFQQWNKGIGLAEGEWIWIAESDDFAEKDFLIKLIKQTEQYPTAGLIYSHLRWVDETGKEMYCQKNSDEILFYDGNNFIKEYLLYSTTIFNISSVIFRKEIFEKLNSTMFEGMEICGDHFFYVLFAEYADVIEVCQILNNFRQTGANISVQKAKDGVDFTEGIAVLDYITNKYKIKPSQYSLHYARLWEKHSHSRSVNRKIRQVFLPNHKRIIFNYYLLRFYHWLKYL